jgi:hypothetical protein
MKITVTCEHCGAVIGKKERFFYRGPDGEDRTDYGDLEPNEDYGGEYYEGHYCARCYEDLVLTEDCLA